MPYFTVSDIYMSQDCKCHLKSFCTNSKRIDLHHNAMRARRASVLRLSFASAAQGLRCVRVFGSGVALDVVNGEFALGFLGDEIFVGDVDQTSHDNLTLELEHVHLSSICPMFLSIDDLD